MANLTVMKGIPFNANRALTWFLEDGYVIVQPKRDEIRCVATVSGGTVAYTSASGKPLHNLSELDTMWLDVASSAGLRTFDCGVCVNGSFDLTCRTVRSSKRPYDLTGGSVEQINTGTARKPNIIHEGPLKAKFWMYDLPDCSGSEFEARLLWMHDIAESYPDTLDVPSECRAYSMQDVTALHESHIAAGLEGSMIKRADHPYVVGRSVNWMKLKPEEEADVEIIGYTEGEGKYQGFIGSIKVRFSDGSTTAISGMSDTVRAAISADREGNIGRIVEMRYMQRDRAGGYRHPRFYRFHPDKTTLD